MDVTFAGCRIDFAVLAAARLDRVVFRNCDLREASLEQAQLRDVRFESCDLSRATLGPEPPPARASWRAAAWTASARCQDLRGAAMPWPDIVDQARAPRRRARASRVATGPGRDRYA